MSIDVLVSEVGPRDGLQSLDVIMPTEAKKAWIRAEAAAGVPEIEVGSFVPPKLLPQMSDCEELVRYAVTIPGLHVTTLAPNLKGVERAVAAGAHKVSIPVSASETHSQANVRKNHAEMLEEVRRINEMLDELPEERRPIFEAGIATAFGCTMEGPVPESKVLELAHALVEAGCREVGLSDTTGYANPAQIRRLVRTVRSEIGEEKLTGVHLHNTRGLGLANAMAALEEGITTLDSSLGGIGGCPFAPGASGNIVTEDLVFMLESMGLNTGIDLDRLLKVRDVVNEALPSTEMYGFTPEAGLPLGFHPGWGTA